MRRVVGIFRIWDQHAPFANGQVISRRHFDVQISQKQRFTLVLDRLTGEWSLDQNDLEPVVE